MSETEIRIREREERELAMPISDAERTRIVMALAPELLAHVEHESRLAFVSDLCDPSGEEGVAGHLIGRLVDYACLQRRAARLLREELIDVLRGTEGAL